MAEHDGVEFGAGVTQAREVPIDIAFEFDTLGLKVLERGWLSSNNVVFLAHGGQPATVVDTGYATHAEQTVQLLGTVLAGASLGRVVNTHLHSDHCGGNALVAEQLGARISVPSRSFDAVQAWDESILSFRRTDQRCDRFVAADCVGAGDHLELGPRRWLAIEGPGHDPDALMFFEPESRVLIAGDVLWRDRLAIVFPELDGRPGFHDVARALDMVEQLRPRIVIPGHGGPFTDVDAAIERSRRRLATFIAEPKRHFAYATRSLAMFRMLEHRASTVHDLEQWMMHADILVTGAAACGIAADEVEAMVRATIQRMVGGGQFSREGEMLRVV